MFYTGLIICWTLKNNYLNIFAFSYRLSEKKNYFQSYFETISKKKNSTIHSPQIHCQLLKVKWGKIILEPHWL